MQTEEENVSNHIGKFKTDTYERQGFLFATISYMRGSWDDLSYKFNKKGDEITETYIVEYMN